MSRWHLCDGNSNDLVQRLFSAVWLTLLDHAGWHGTCAVAVEPCTHMPAVSKLLCLWFCWHLYFSAIIHTKNNHISIKHSLLFITLTHSLVNLPRWGLATADDHSNIFLLHCARSCGISFSWMYSQPVHSSMLCIHCLLGLPWCRNHDSF